MSGLNLFFITHQSITLKASLFNPILYSINSSLLDSNPTIKMKFFAVAATFAATAVALPNANGGHKDPHQLTLEQAQNTCGKAQVSCCNKQIKSGDSFEKNEGVLNGVLKGILGDRGSEGLALFDQCSELDISSMFSLLHP